MVVRCKQKTAPATDQQTILNTLTCPGRYAYTTLCIGPPTIPSFRFNTPYVVADQLRTLKINKEMDEKGKQSTKLRGLKRSCDAQ